MVILKGLTLFSSLWPICLDQKVDFLHDFKKRISYVLWLGIWRSAYSPLAFWSVYPLNNVEEQFIIFAKSWKSITIHPEPSGAELENNFVVKTLVYSEELQKEICPEGIHPFRDQQLCNPGCKDFSLEMSNGRAWHFKVFKWQIFREGDEK